jgi:carboxyvinyl-carboxyphosphonate phosphorylmutase
MDSRTDESLLKVHGASAARSLLRAMINEPGCVMPASVFDPVSARIAFHHGVPAVMLSGSVASTVYLGDPDIMTMTLTELSGLAGRIARATPLPLIVDADHGFGNALNASRTVAELEREGVAAMTLEDTLLPLSYPAGASAQLIPIDEAVGKVSAAIERRTDPDFLIIARTGAAGLDDMADTIARLKAYAACGADMVFVRGIESLEQVAQLEVAVDLPIVLSVKNPALRDTEVLKDTNVRIVLPGQKPIMAAYQAVSNAVQSDVDGTPFKETMSAAELRKYTCDDIHQARVEAFMTGKGTPAE